MELSFDILPVLVGWSLVFCVIYSLLYKRFIFSIVDPLLVWVFTTGFASVLAIQIIPDTWNIVHFFACQIALWIGFVYAHGSKKVFDNSIVRPANYNDFFDLLLLRNITYLLLSIYIISNIIVGYSKGFALLSDTPSESKIGDFQDGFGLFRKINWSSGTFVSTSLVFLYLMQKRRTDLVILIVVSLLTSLEGSKSALLQIVISAGLVFYHPAFSSQKEVLKRFQRYTPILFLGIMIVFFLVLLKENSGYDDAFLSFIKRLLYSADSLIYYYTPVNFSYFDNYTFWDYITHNLTNPILGFFHIEPYKVSLGNVMIENLRSPDSTTSVTVGPNLPFYLEGRIYFNFWVAIPYSMLVGYVYAWTRIYYFSLRRTSAFYFVYMASFCHFASAIIIDVNLAVVQLFNLAFFVLPVYVFASLVFNGKLKIRLNLNKFKSIDII